ncbi:MAG: FixH family protein [Cyclobacteriaceae bacterium]|nr:FixH family protein [Cyclobacteriaceae bacterium]
MNWGKWIVVSFVLFAAFIGTLVTVCVRQDVNLVTKDYYKDELVYQDQIERQQNARVLDSKPSFTIIDQTYLVVSFDLFGEVEKGEVKLFRPSNEKLDQNFAIQTSGDVTQRFKLGAVDNGMYRVKMFWTMNGKEYYTEEVIYI